MRAAAKRLIVLAALAAAASPGRAAVKDPGTFTYLTIADVDSLDPAWAYDTASHEILANIYEYLLAFKGGSLKNLEPRLAAKVPSLKNGLISKDGRTYTFPIRRGVKFQDGAPLTAEDVKYSLLRFMLQDRDGGPSALLLEPILGVSSSRSDGKPLDDLFKRADQAVQARDGNLIIKLKEPYAPFLTILPSWGAVVSRSWCAAHGDWDGTEASWKKFNNPQHDASFLMDHADGTGPYALERWDKAGKEVSLVRFDGYWRGPAKLARVRIKGVEDFNTRKLYLASGDADVIYAPQMLFPQVAGLDGVQVIDKLQDLEASAVIFFTFKINPEANPNLGSGRLDGQGIPPDFFADKEVRRGFAYAVDFDAYVRDILRGKGHQAYGFIPKGLTGYSSSAPHYSFDLKKAKDHFMKAFDGKAWANGFSFTLVFNEGSTPAQVIGQMLKKNVEALNPKFKIDLRPMQWSTFLDQSNAGKLPMYMGAWQADYPDTHNFAYPFMHSHGYFAMKQGYSNPEADKLVEEGSRTLDPGKRQRIYEKLQRIAYDDVPHVMIADGFRYRAQRKWVKGWVFNPVFPDSPYGSYYYDLRKED